MSENSIYIDSSNSKQLKWLVWKHKTIGTTHCRSCLSLDGCWFISYKMPSIPLHEKCHCFTATVPTSYVNENAYAISAYAKYNPYLFDPHAVYNHGKNMLFESWGYSISDATWLQNEIEQQCREQYLLGNYELGKLNNHGQRISIRVTLPKKDGTEKVSFLTGWLIQSDGEIKLTTPYGGK